MFFIFIFILVYFLFSALFPLSLSCLLFHIFSFKMFNFSHSTFLINLQSKGKMHWAKKWVNVLFPFASFSHSIFFYFLIYSRCFISYFAHFLSFPLLFSFFYLSLLPHSLILLHFLNNLFHFIFIHLFSFVSSSSYFTLFHHSLIFFISLTYFIQFPHSFI